jgi:hypothetical protein
MPSVHRGAFHQEPARRPMMAIVNPDRVLDLRQLHRRSAPTEPEGPRPKKKTPRARQVRSLLFTSHTRCFEYGSTNLCLGRTARESAPAGACGRLPASRLCGRSSPDDAKINIYSIDAAALDNASEQRHHASCTADAGSHRSGTGWQWQFQGRRRGRATAGARLRLAIFRAPVSECQLPYSHAYVD